MRAQLKEIITRYDPAVMWFDGEWQSSWNHQRGVDLYNYCRSLKPDLIINNRVDNARAGMSGMSSNANAVGDFGTPEQEIPANGIKGDWESCMTMNGSWGFHANDTNWKSVDTLIFNAVDCASKGGNYLLNVGPTSLGEIPPASIDRLNGVGAWLKVNSEALYGTQASPFPRPMPWGRVTRKGKTLYCVVFKNEEYLPILTGLKTPIVAASILGVRERITVVQTITGPALDLPHNIRTEPIVVKVTIAGEPEIETFLPTQDANGAITFGAADAECTGAAHFEDAKKAIGFWTETTDTVTWKFNASKPGTYHLTAEVACQDDSAGSLISVTYENQEKQLLIKGTGGWEKFVTVNFGNISVSETGNTKISVRARMKPGYAVMNLRSLKLTPVSADAR